MSPSALLRLTGRDVLPLLQRTTTQSFDDLAPGGSRTTLFCDFRGRLQHRATLGLAAEGVVWLLRADGPGNELAAAIEKSVFRDDVRVEDWSPRCQVVLGPALAGVAGILAVRDGVPVAVAVGDGTLLATDGRTALTETERIARLRPRHGFEVADSFNPFEVGLATEVHLAKGCFTGQEALQRLITYDSVRRRPAHVRLDSEVTSVPVDILADDLRVGTLTSAAGRDGFAVIRHEALQKRAALTLADGTGMCVVASPELSRPLGRP